ncbi:MAG: cupin domain-containing protein [Candidatus Accumulibacter sp.]|uniref:cupin domain-containing protein n=1 Tax=Accumulibacter sp. TaxID=2053492 RepID=UPI001A4912F1|nr:cupin domain-containing protein [Accumulibacter sp.]MBL8393452.1 cupin domain-containing protein [Accumulibacter sp.]
MKTSYHDIPVHITKDGSEIRELMHPAVHGNQRQSLAEAVIQPGQQTLLHRHPVSEELYHVTSGSGLLSLGSETLSIAVGDTVLIPPGTPHRVLATGIEALHLLCCCSPAYRHEDTELL